MPKRSALVLVTLLSLSGCFLSYKYDLVQNGIVCVDLEAPNEFPLRDLSVREEGDGIIIKGFLGSYTPAHDVTLQILAPDGEELWLTSVPAVRSNRRTTGRRFEASAPIDPPKGSTLRIAY